MTDMYEGHAPSKGHNGTYGGVLYAAEATRVIAAHNVSEPMFLYLAWQVTRNGSSRYM